MGDEIFGEDETDQRGGRIVTDVKNYMYILHQITLLNYPDNYIKIYM